MTDRIYGIKQIYKTPVARSRYKKITEVENEIISRAKQEMDSYSRRNRSGRCRSQKIVRAEAPTVTKQARHDGFLSAGGVNRPLARGNREDFRSRGTARADLLIHSFRPVRITRLSQEHASKK